MRHPQPAAAGAAPRGDKRAPLRRASGTSAARAAVRATATFFEDRVIGEIADLGAHTFAKDEIIAFAREYDPAALPSRRGGGEGLAVRRAVRVGLAHGGASTSAGRRDASRSRPPMPPRRRRRKLASLRPLAGLQGPALAQARVRRRHHRLPHPHSEKIDLKSRPDRGLMRERRQGRNQHGEIVFAIMSQILVERREPFRP